MITCRILLPGTTNNSHIISIKTPTNNDPGKIGNIIGISDNIHKNVPITKRIYTCILRDILKVLKILYSIEFYHKVYKYVKVPSNIIL